MQRKKILALSLVLALALALCACGESGGGGGAAAQPGPQSTGTWTEQPDGSTDPMEYMTTTLQDEIPAEWTLPEDVTIGSQTRVEVKGDKILYGEVGESGFVENITVARDDSLSHRGERSVVFYYYPGGENAQPQPFLTIYRLTGSNRQARAKLPGRVTLYSDSTTIFAASLQEDVWDCKLEQENLAPRFFLITAAWDSEI